MDFLNRITDTLKKQGASTQIILINVVVFLTLNMVLSLSHLPKSAGLEYLALPVNGPHFLVRFWTLFTFAFTHVDFWHLLSNMLIFYFMSQVFFIVFKSQKLYYVYIMSGVAGGVLMLLLSMLFTNSFLQPHLFGASSAILGVGAVMLVYTPNYQMLLFGVFSMAYKYIYLIMFVLTTLVDISTNTGGKISHMGGAAFGLVYAYYLKKGNDFLNFSFFTKKRSKLKIVSNNQNYKKPVESNYLNDEQKMNQLLEKISKSGYESLTRSEKDELFKLSQKK